MYGERLRELRAEQGLTQQQLGELLGVSQFSVSKYEREALDLNTDTLIRLCGIFGVSADYLLGLDEGKR